MTQEVMWDKDAALYPTAPSPEIVNYPIKKVGATYVNNEKTMSASLLWKLQQAVAQAKFEVLQYILEEGYVPVSDDEFDISVEVKAYVQRRAVDGEATEGKWITVPAHMNHLAAMKTQSLTGR